MTNKSFVSMGLCPLCQKENGTILMDKRVRDSMEKHTMTLDVCDKCQEKYLKIGVMLVGKETEHSDEVKAVMVIKDKAFKHFFPTLKIPKEKIAFCDIRVINEIKENYGKVLQNK